MNEKEILELVQQVTENQKKLEERIQKLESDVSRLNGHFVQYR